ncbi:helicase [Brevibacterium paucivorans]|uniref:Helicase n=1 Tax=Brevibacterium paucivorans TaxID=170994 RepID=A0A2N6VQR2_9MICO|nr:helicase [Brevibacterium paucivorans]
MRCFSEEGGTVDDNRVNVGDLVFNDIDSNGFLHELYASLLHNYGVRRLLLGEGRQTFEVDVEAALRFADLLSKSTHPDKRDVHRVWAQEIALLCHILYPDSPYTQVYVPAVFTTLGNYPGLRQLGATSDAGILAAAFEAYQAEYLSVPGVPGMRFFAPQKRIYDQLASGEFSFSAPTSLGKSFIMRTFITSQVKAESRSNFAIIVPTKALINETRSKLIGELEDELERHNYRIVSAAGDIVLEGQHNFIFVLTPERLLYLLISRPDLRFDYVFFDESHKLSGKNSRAPFYYQTVTLLQQHHFPPHIIFASPNIPNPEVFLRLISPKDESREGKAIATRYSPVAQFKYLVDMDEKTLSTYNDHSQGFTHLASIEKTLTLAELTQFLTKSTSAGEGRVAQTLVFCSGRQRAVDAAEEYAHLLPMLNDPDLEALAKDVERDVHEDYYLCGLLRQGIAYHIGYLPPAIRERIEDLFRAGKITTLFCTSTLLEGVNLPADNLIITTNKIGRPNMSPVDFKNLIGRVGRIEYNLYGNVFIVTGDRLANKNTTKELLQAQIPEQKLSIETDSRVISGQMKKGIVEDLTQGNVEFPKGDESYEVYEMKRKFGLILLRDITQGRDSLVRHEFAPFLGGDTIQAIREAFGERANKQDDDINVSIDQAETLTDAIRAGLRYPELSSDRKFNYDDTLAFLQRLSRIFKWTTYEPQSLGKTSQDGSSLTLLRWYAVLLNQWMEGHGLRSIMDRALEYRHKEGTIYIPWKGQLPYDDSPAQRNIVFGDILQTIENVILFSLSNYFLKFSNEYKAIHGVEQFDNDWYEYVQYGTTNPTTILLQRFGFTRESATYIRRNVSRPLIQEGSEYYLNPALLESQNRNVRKEANEIRFNVPEAFSLPASRF